MSESVKPSLEGMSLVSFLADLRSDLVKAQASAELAAAKAKDRGESPLLFGLGEVAVTLEVAHTTSTAVTGKAEAEAKFWVFASAKAGGEAGREWSHTGTQTLTLKLTPKFLEETTDSEGNTTQHHRSPEISGKADPGELPPD